MRGDPEAHRGPTVFATHSTHKMLAALSQASYIHVRDGKGAIDHHRFNQAYMMHTTTSPLYAIVASNDITSAMMDGSSGRSLTQEVIDEAVDFRQVMGRLWRTFADKDAFLIEGDVPGYPGGVSPIGCILPGTTFSGGLVPGGLIERMKAMIFHRSSAVLMV